ncbi:hypothetical protein NDU88_001520 [Pleurodeles waltl]|uniref:Uncharacterized protein n=1 Tax=Pleurodeles waltl TaxID=8319 RepID=A0AAV7KR64_PLEWA|nr:hypothetical protein NDU88_001520 [Pleurodeles waltl]
MQHDGSDVSGTETPKAGRVIEKGRARRRTRVRVELPDTTEEEVETEDTVGEGNPGGRDTAEKTSHVPGGPWHKQATKRNAGLVLRMTYPRDDLLLLCFDTFPEPQL